MTDRYTRSMVEDKFARFCKALTKHGVDTSNYRLECNHARYRVIEIMMPSYGESNPFGARVRNGEEMWTTLDFAEEALAIVWRESRAHYDLADYSGDGRETLASGLTYTEARTAHAQLRASGRSVYMIEQEQT